MYKLTYSKQAIKVLKKIPRNLSTLIRTKLEVLAKNPHREHPNLKILRGMDASRLRIGDWRVICQIKNEELEIWVIKIAPRGEAYKL